MKIILASQSVARKKLLSLLKVPFYVVPSEIDEKKIIGTTPLETIRLRAKAKAEKIAKKLSSNKLDCSIARLLDCLIISADSMAVVNGKLIGKPKNKKEAREILKLLSGKTHQFVTHVYAVKLLPVWRNQILKIWSKYEKSLVAIRKLSDDDINLYLNLTNYKLYAGSYALYDSPQDFVTKVEGSISNIMGLPLEKIIPILRENKIFD